METNQAKQLDTLLNQPLKVLKKSKTLKRPMPQPLQNGKIDPILFL